MATPSFSLTGGNPSAAKAVSFAVGPNAGARAARYAVLLIIEAIVLRLVFAAGPELIVGGATLGMTYGLMAVGLILVYRTNRIINFAVAAIGAIPAVTGVLLQTRKGLPYPFALAVAVFGGLLIGGLIDVVVIRRFAKAPRLILVVATLGIAQSLAYIAIYIPIWLGSKGEQTSLVKTPWSRDLIKDNLGHPILKGDQIFAVVAVVALCAGLAAFFRYTRVGIALRASAENADRALLLGIPVKRVGTVAWMLAGLFGSITIFLRAPLFGVPADGSLGPNILLAALTAAVIAKFDDIPLALVAGTGVGMMEFASVKGAGEPSLAYAITLVVILIALALQRKSQSRALDTGVSTFQAVKEFRPVPSELRDLAEVRTGKAILGVIIAVVVCATPYLASTGDLGKLNLIPIYAIVAVSMVILSGWAGQISLGQFGLVGAGAVAAGGLAANHNIDFFIALIVGVGMGAIVAALLGIPAVRVQGLYLAVVTLAFAAAAENYLYRDKYFLGKNLHLFPKGNDVPRPLLWGRIDLRNERTMYFVCVIALVVAVLAARAFRRNRSGRVLIASRDNQRGAPAYGINLARTRLAAFAVSGGLAGLAGVLYAYQQRAVDHASLGLNNSIQIFIVAVIGGLTSIPGAILGTVIIEGIALFGDKYLFKNVTLLVTGPGLLLILLFLPGGLAEGMYRIRDAFLRRLAIAKGIHVPSLVADRRIETGEGERSVIEEAEHQVESVESFDVHASPHITCPVCGDTLPLSEAADHEHLKAAAPA